MSPSANPSSAQIARFQLRVALKGSLATLDATSGAPFATLVNVATDVDGSPLLLLSGLARHTANLAADPRASLLLDSTNRAGAAGSGVRLTLTCRAKRTDSARLRQRYLSRLREATTVAGFGDFAFWRLEIEAGHLIAGFGRIEALGAADLLLEPAAAAELEVEQAALLGELAEIPGEARMVLAQRASASAPVWARVEADNWIVTGVDPEGLDLRAEMHTARLQFDTPVATADQVRERLGLRGLL